MLSTQRVSRRAVLAGAGLGAAITGIGAFALPLAFARTEGDPEIRAATWWRDQLVALTESADEPGRFALRHLDIGADGTVTLGADIGTQLPKDLVPVGIAATDEVLWIGGAIDRLDSVVTVDNRIEELPAELRELTSEEDLDPALPIGVFELEVRQARPGLLRVDDEATEYVDLPVPDDIRSGVVSSVEVAPGGVLGVVIDGCDDPDLTMVTSSHVAVSHDRGATWDSSLLASEIGESYGSALVAMDGAFFAVTSTGSEEQTIRRAADLGVDFEVVDTIPDAGTPVTVGSGEGAQLVIINQVGGDLAEYHYSDRQSTTESGDTTAACGCAGHLITVRGTQSEWLEANGPDLRLTER